MAAAAQSRAAVRILSGSLARMGRRERAARLPLLQSGDHSSPLRGRSQVTYHIWRRWLEAAIQSIREQMPGAGGRAECIQRRRRNKN